MPNGVFKIINIPTDKVPTVVANFQLDSPDNIEEIDQGGGLWTVKATFPGADETQEEFRE